MASSSSSSVIEHPVFFAMPGLLEHPDTETEILRGLSDLKHSPHSDLHFLYAGKLKESRGVPFTHALVSRFPSVDALRVYYQFAIKDIAQKMRPWLKGEFCVDYEVSLNNEAIKLTETDEKSLAFYVVFIKVKADTSETAISTTKESFLSLRNQLDYVTQLTTGENLYLRESYRTSSHAFSIYLPSSEELEKLQADRTFLSVLNDQILPIAESYAIVAFEPLRN